MGVFARLQEPTARNEGGIDPHGLITSVASWRHAPTLIGLRVDNDERRRLIRSRVWQCHWGNLVEQLVCLSLEDKLLAGCIG